MKPAFVVLGIAAAAAVGVVVWSAMRARPGQSIAQSIGETVGEVVGSAVVDGAAGVVVGAGKAVGIPATNETECEKALREGRTWDASFACPAGKFLGSLWD